MRALDQADGVAFCAQTRPRSAGPAATPRHSQSRCAERRGHRTACAHWRRRREATVALFVGGLRYAPNAEAARFIAGRLAPLLAARGLTAVIAGGGGADAPGVRFAGRPADLEPLYAQAFAAVVPIFSGSGTRLKVLEALAYGRPVVATAKAVEGLALEPGVHYLAAEDEAAFAAQLGRLANEPALAAALSCRGRAVAEAKHSWASAGAAFLQLLAECGVPEEA